MKISFFSIISITLSFLVFCLGLSEVIGYTNLTGPIEELLKSKFIDVPSFLIILGGIATYNFLSFKTVDVMHAFVYSFLFFHQPKKQNKVLEEELDSVLNWNERIHDNRIKAIDEIIEENKGSFTEFIYNLFSTNYSIEDIKKIASNRIEEEYDKKHITIEITKKTGASAPAFGMVGTLFGLIVMLGNLQNPDQVGPGLSTALITTLYGILYARFFALPISVKLENKLELERKQKYFLLQGIVLVFENRSTFYIEDSLKSFMNQ